MLQGKEAAGKRPAELGVETLVVETLSNWTFPNLGEPLWPSSLLAVAPGRELGT